LEAGLGLAGPVAEPGLPLEAGLGLARERAPDPCKQAVQAGLALLRDWAQRTVLVMDWADLSSADEARLALDLPLDLQARLAVEARLEQVEQAGAITRPHIASPPARRGGKAGSGDGTNGYPTGH
jgi:hypothetical protein